MAKITFGYWDLRGLAEPIRYLLHYKNVEFEEKKYSLNHREQWQKEKFTLGLDFPNLPFYFDGCVKLTQSITILRYLAEKHGLDGKTGEERLRISLVEQQLVDLRQNLARHVYSGDQFEKNHPQFVENAPLQFRQLSDFLGDRKFLAGESITYVDFLAYNTIDFYRYMLPEVVNQFPNLRGYLVRIKKLPELQKYLQSSAYQPWPLFGDAARFGGGGPEPQHE